MFSATVSSSKAKEKIASRRWAVIDLGTNSLRLDVYETQGRRQKRLYRDKNMVRLGDGVFETGLLTRDGMRRTLKAFLGYKRLLSEMGVEKVVAFGTSALRSSRNARVLLDAIHDQTGIAVRVISGPEEGRLIAKGVIANEKLPQGRYALIDIGGGSTEISICQGERVLMCRSLPLGANRLQQTFLKAQPPLWKKKDLHPVLALRQHLKEQLQPLVKHSANKNIQVILGSSGTVRGLGRIFKKLHPRQPVILRAELSALIAEMQTMTRAELRAIPGMEAKRIDLILAGSIVLEEVLFALDVKKLRVTEFALRDGILELELESRAKSAAH